MLFEKNQKNYYHFEKFSKHFITDNLSLLSLTTVTNFNEVYKISVMEAEDQPCMTT